MFNLRKNIITRALPYIISPVIAFSNFMPRTANAYNQSETITKVSESLDLLIKQEDFPFYVIVGNESYELKADGTIPGRVGRENPDQGTRKKIIEAFLLNEVLTEGCKEGLAEWCVDVEDLESQIQNLEKELDRNARSVVMGLIKEVFPGDQDFEYEDSYSPSVFERLKVIFSIPFEKTVDPKFVSYKMIYYGKIGDSTLRLRIPKLKENLEEIKYLDKNFANHQDLLRIISEIVEAQPYIMSSTKLLQDLQKTENPIFQVRPEEVKEYKEIFWRNIFNKKRFEEQSKGLLSRIRERNKDSDEFKEFISKVEGTRGIWNDFYTAIQNYNINFPQEPSEDSEIYSNKTLESNLVFKPFKIVGVEGKIRPGDNKVNLCIENIGDITLYNIDVQFNSIISTGLGRIRENILERNKINSLGPGKTGCILLSLRYWGKSVKEEYLLDVETNFSYSTEEGKKENSNTTEKKELKLVFESAL